MQHARIQLANGLYDASTKTLADTYILPFEGSFQGKKVYEQALINAAIDLINAKKYKPAMAKLVQSRAWPESLGVGAPYNPDNRLQQYLQAICLEKTGNAAGAAALRDSVIAYTQTEGNLTRPNFGNLLALQLLQSKGAATEAAKLVEALKQQPAYSNPVHQYTVAVFNNNASAAAGLEKSLSTNNYYIIIKKILALK